MKAHIRIFAVVFSILIATSVFAGCKQGASESEVDEGTSGSENLPKLVIDNKKVSILSQSAASEFTTTTDIVKKAYGLDATYTAVSWTDLGTKLTQLVLAGNPPDIYYGRARDFPIIAKKNLLTPLDDLIDFNSAIFKDTPETLAECMYEGKHYAATSKGYIAQVMWYNEKSFKETGEKTPRELFNENNWDWDSFLKAAINLTDEKEGTYGLGSLRSLDFYLTTGKDVIKFEADGAPTSLLRDPDISEAMEFWRTLGVGKHKVITTEYSPLEQFKAGKIAMIIDGMWLASSQLSEMSKNGEVNFVPIPKYPKADKYYSWGSYSTLCIPKGAKNINGALGYIYSTLFPANVEKSIVEKDPLYSAQQKKNRDDLISKAGFDEEDFAMNDFITKETIPVFEASERIAGYTDYLTWVVCDKMRKDGSSWLQNLEIQEPWLQGMIDTYNEDVRGIKPTSSGE